MKTKKILYWISTGLMCLLLCFSAFMYFTNTEQLQSGFESFGYPAYIVIPLGIAKILAVIAIISNLSVTLKEWAYFGLLMDFILAAVAHLVAGDREAGGAFMATALWLGSYIFWKQI